MGNLERNLSKFSLLLQLKCESISTPLLADTRIPTEIPLHNFLMQITYFLQTFVIIKKIITNSYNFYFNNYLLFIIFAFSYLYSRDQQNGPRKYNNPLIRELTVKLHRYFDCRSLNFSEAYRQFQENADIPACSMSLLVTFRRHQSCCGVGHRPVDLFIFWKTSFKACLLLWTFCSDHKLCNRGVLDASCIISIPKPRRQV